MEQATNNRRAGWTPPSRPDWVARINEEGTHLDIKGIVPLDSQSLLATATTNTGLSDFGSEDWREPFEVICRGLDAEADLTLMGRIMTRSDMLMMLEGRLEVEAAYKAHPEIEDEEIAAPMLIIGQGRSGTSALVNLLSMDPENAVTQTWQAMFPGLQREPGEPDPRIERADGRVTMWTRVTPELSAIHEFRAAIPTESIHTETLSFQMPSWQSLYGQTPSHYIYMAGRSMVPAIAYEKRVLKLLQWRKPKRHWVLKSPDALNYLPDVLKVYPDVRLVWSHRDPLKSLASAVNMVGVLAFARSDRVMSEGTFDTVTDPGICANMLSQPIDWLASGVLPKAQLHNIQYRDLISDPMEVADSIYRYCGRTLAGASRAAMQRYVDENPRSNRPAHRYAQVDDSIERQAFRRYQEYFDVPNEA